MTKITYDTLPEAVEHLIKQVENLTVTLEREKTEVPSIKEVLDAREALDYLHELGYKIRLSSLYKLCSKSRAIPHSKLANKLVFRRTELEKWVENQSTKKQIINQSAVSSSARKKLKS